jgi:hypothetical protein
MAIVTITAPQASAIQAGGRQGGEEITVAYPAVSAGRSSGLPRFEAPNQTGAGNAHRVSGPQQRERVAEATPRLPSSLPPARA